MANPYPEGSPLFYIAEGARIYEEMVADPRHPYHQPCERVYVCCGGKEAPMGTGHYSICASSQLTSIPTDCATHGCAWPDEGECPAKVKAG